MNQNESKEREAGREIYLSVVIPAYNEKDRLPDTLLATVDYLKGQNYTSEVLVVDDGSKDNTAQVSRELFEKMRSSEGGKVVNMEALQYPDKQNRGKGYAVRYGMQKARGNYRVFMDADNSTTIDHVERFFPYAENKGFDIVIGSRDVEGADIAVHQAWYKELLGNLGNLFIRIVAVPGIYDTQAGFKMFSTESVNDIFPRLTIDRWGFDIEILAVARRFKYRIKEVPITWVNDPDSKVSAKAYLEVLGEVVRVRWNMIRGVYGKKRPK